MDHYNVEPSIDSMAYDVQRTCYKSLLLVIPQWQQSKGKVAVPICRQKTQWTS